MFWFKKKKIVLDCFTADPFVYEYASIQPSVKYYPEWWTNLPLTVERDVLREWGLFKDKVIKSDFTTMKACRGLTGLYKNSFVIPFWGNLEFFIKNKDQKAYYWQDDFTKKLGTADKSVSFHPQLQYSGWVSDEYVHAKLISPWSLKTNRFVQFALVEPTWNKRELNDYTTLPGVLDFKYQHGININLMLKLESVERNLLFEVGTPMAHIIPLSEENIELKNHLVSVDDFCRLMPSERINYKGLISSKKYSRVRSFLQKHEERNKPKCPFGFGK